MKKEPVKIVAIVTLYGPRGIVAEFKTTDPPVVSASMRERGLGGGSTEYMPITLITFKTIAGTVITLSPGIHAYTIEVF